MYVPAELKKPYSMSPVLAADVDVDSTRVPRAAMPLLLTTARFMWWDEERCDSTLEYIACGLYDAETLVN